MGNKTLIEQVTEKLIDSEVDEIIIVTGHEDHKINELFYQKYDDAKLKIVSNTKYRQGMTTSIQKGIKSTNSKTAGYMICLGDMPLIDTTELNEIITAFQTALTNNLKTIIVPLYNKKRGNPVIFSSSYHDEILAHDEVNGCRGIVKRNSKEVIQLEMSSNHILVDVDTLDEYNDIVQ